MTNNWYPGESDEEDDLTGWGIPDDDGWVQLSRIVKVSPGSPWVPLDKRQPSEVEQSQLIVSCNQYTRQLFIGIDLRATHWAVLGDP